jgi:hypothetical protein
MRDSSLAGQLYMLTEQQILEKNDTYLDKYLHQL